MDARENETPAYQDGKLYLVKGETLNKLFKEIRRNRFRFTPNGGLKIDQITTDGTFVSVDGTTCS